MHFKIEVLDATSFYLFIVHMYSRIPLSYILQIWHISYVSVQAYVLHSTWYCEFNFRQ